AAPVVDGWDLAAFWKPVHNVAGDFYDFFPLDDGRLALLIADVSGKGIPASLFMALAVTVLRFGMGLSLKPGEMIERANDGIRKYQRSRFFATIFVGYLDLENGEMEFASAGHNPPMLYRAAAKTVEYIEASGVAVGVFAGVKYEEKIIQLEPDDVLVLYTDGITEIINAVEEEFGEAHLETLIVENAGADAQTLVDIIVHAIHDFAGVADSFDDETLIVIKHTPHTPR
ncbi:MAG TPA: PP2C family protein-serine/threonine phosphatase, partial [Aggregatilineales bacterium]|nr:PP2C family protein-serine/threonine phosphatase [Aggregatilineales bacterium]